MCRAGVLGARQTTGDSSQRELVCPLGNVDRWALFGRAAGLAGFLVVSGLRGREGWDGAVGDAGGVSCGEVAAVHWQSTGIALALLWHCSGNGLVGGFHLLIGVLGLAVRQVASIRWFRRFFDRL